VLLYGSGVTGKVGPEENLDDADALHVFGVDLHSMVNVFDPGSGSGHALFSRDYESKRCPDQCKSPINRQHHIQATECTLQGDCYNRREKLTEKEGARPYTGTTSAKHWRQDSHGPGQECG
jgi:hypothetical protein